MLAALLTALLLFAGPAGEVIPEGDATDHGDIAGLDVNSPIVGMAASPSGGGYWLVAADGGVFAFGDAGFFGSTGSLVLSSPIVGMATSPSGGGYWLVAADGGVFAFGDAGFFGSTGSLVLNSPIVGMATTSSGGGYWLVAADGGVFAFGDAGFFGSTGSLVLNSPIVGMATTSSAAGYWLAAADGGVFSFGDAPFLGSAAEQGFGRPVVGFGADDAGYAMVTADGAVAAFSDGASSLTSADCRAEPVSGFVPNPVGDGWWITTSPLPVPRTVPSASSSGIDSVAVDELLSYAQACQGEVVAPAADSLSSPVPGARLSSSFGSRVHPIWGVRQLHAGADAAAPTGTPVVAADEGVVVQVADGLTAYGTIVVVDHGDRVATLYAHLSAVDVAVGQEIARGEQLGRVGTTGFATGPHLHFEVRLDGVPVDPVRSLDAVFASPLR